MIDTYKGVRDFYPEDLRVQNFIFSAMRRAAESYGYEEMNASILEATELYTAKTSEEIVGQQTYTFIDRGERSVTLRPEMTPTVARMVAARKRELAFPLRWYSIQNFFRYERPQRGRGREFWQLNADLFGVPGIEGDAEAISLAYRVMEELGADDNMFTIRIGSRKVLDAAMREAGITGDNAKKYRSILDQKRKMEPKEYASAVHEISDTDPLKMIQNKTGSVAEALVSIDALLSRLEKSGVPAVHDPSIVRGFDYYTDIVFEVFDTDSANPRSLFGGGRYDKLVEQYGAENVPAVGFAMGDMVARDFLETHKLLPTLLPTTHLFLAPVGEDNVADVNELASDLRLQGIRVAVGLSTKAGKSEKVGDHIKTAAKLGIPFFIAFGADEAGNNKVKVKNLIAETEEELSFDQIANYLLNA